MFGKKSSLLVFEKENSLLVFGKENTLFVYGCHLLFARLIFDKM